MMIRLENVSKKYQYGDTTTCVLHEVDLQISSGEFVVVMGPSGSGKSTLLNILGLLDGFDEGEYWLDGVYAKKLNPKEKMILRTQKIGFIFQSFNLISDLTVFQNVELPLVFQDVKKHERVVTVNKMLARLGVDHRKNYYPGYLSGGEQQRVAIARTLVSNPQIILADEPTGNLDTETGFEILNILEQLHQEGKTVILVTHDERLKKYADRMIKIQDGMIRHE